MAEHILNVIRVRRERRDEIGATDVVAELRAGASCMVVDEMLRGPLDALALAESAVTNSILHSLYGDLEVLLCRLGQYATARAKEDADARVIQGMLNECLELIGAKRQSLADMAVRVVDEGTGYPELYFNENRETFTTGEMT